MVLSQSQTSRPGVSLTEVLVAMFVMALGMIALMTLFPLGAMQVGQALRDDRASQLARQADGYLRQWWRHSVLAKPINHDEPAVWAMDDPNLVLHTSPNNSSVYTDTYLGSAAYGPVASLPATSILPTGATIPTTAPNPISPYAVLQNPRYTGPTGSLVPLVDARQVYTLTGNASSVTSYPSMIDPIGFANRSGIDNEKVWVARNAVNTNYNGFLLPRRTLKAISEGLGTPLDVAGLTDDMSFNPNGAPQGGTVIGRQGRFTWTAVIQRPRNDVRNVADLQVLIYDQRPVLPQPGDECVVNPGSGYLTGTRTLTLTLPNRSENQTVLIRRGGWVIDGTIDASTTPAASGVRRNFIPYRISGITETGTSATPSPLGSTTFDIDLETPLKADLTTSSQLYFLAGLIEVFQRPQLRPDVNY